MYYKLCIMHYELMWAFRQAVGLSAISLLAYPAPESRPRIPSPVPAPESRIPFPVPAPESCSPSPHPNPVPCPRTRIPLAKDAASIPNAKWRLDKCAASL